MRPNLSMLLNWAIEAAAPQVTPQPRDIRTQKLCSGIAGTRQTLTSSATSSG